MGVNRLERKDRRGGGYSRRKFTFQEAEAIRKEYFDGDITQEALALKYNVSQPLLNQLLSYKTYKG